MKQEPIRTERVYVKFNSDFDATDYMLPRAIAWKDGRVFPIEALRDCRPAAMLHEVSTTSCYTVVVKGTT